MKYIGSKNRIAKQILPIILKDRKEGQWYVEPFVGGANMIDKVDGNRIGSDINKQIISLLKKLQTDWCPPLDVTKEEYNNMKSNKGEYEDFLLGYVGFQLSYGAVYFASYRQDNIGRRNYSLEAYNNVMKQKPSIQNIIFEHSNYQDLNIPNNSIIYCDIPYENTDKKAYRGNKEIFNHLEFWEWCRAKSREGHKVFISEYSAPSDFECIWEKEINQNVNNAIKSKKGIEKLFIYKN